MADRVVSVRLRAEVDQYRRDMQDAAKNTKGVADAAEGSSGAMSKLSTAARAIGRTVATGTTVAAGALAALTVSTFKTGVAYNTLEQTSRAALTTLLGSAEAAAEQMDKLREFGKTSPFPRQVWIEAQQQLLAFGFAAENVIPTLDAIQDAVAAAGGSAQDITEIVRVLAQVQSTGKVTAETLNQLGIRGVDAATLLGNAMGKSAQQIREDISSGALDAAVFLEMLTDTMSERFGGAAEGVKETWVGATDRIKGAIRDIGSILATPFVDPNGGGAAVQWANDAADALRAFEAQAESVVDILAQKADPTLQAVSQKLQSLTEKIKNTDVEKLIRDFREMAPAVAGASAALTALGAGPILARLGLQMGPHGPLVAGIMAMVAASPELRDAVLDLLKAFTPLIPPIAQTAELFATTLSPVLTVVASLLQPVAVAVEAVARYFGDLPGVIQAAVIAFAAFKMLNLGSLFSPLTGAVKRFGEHMQVQASLAKSAGKEVGKMGAAYAVASSRVKYAASAMGGAKTALAAIALGAGLAFEQMNRLNPQTDALAVGLERLAQTGKISGELRRLMGGDLEGLQTAFVQLTDTGVTRFLNGVAEIIPGVSAMDNSISKSEERINALDSALANLVKENPEMATEVFHRLTEQLGLTDEEFKKLWELLPQYSGALEVAGEKTDDAATSTEKLTPKQEALAEKFGLTAEEAQNASTELDTLDGSLRTLFDNTFGLEGAQDKLDAAFQRVNEQIQRQKERAVAGAGALSGHTEAARDNRGAMKDVSQAIADLIAQTWEETGSIEAVNEETERQKQRLRELGTQLGWSNTDIKRYTGFIDDARDAVIKTNKTPLKPKADMRDAINTIRGGTRDINDLMKGIENKTVKVRAEYQFYAGTGATATELRGFVNVGKKRDGGPITGPGGPRDDAIPTWLSNGEYVMKSASVAKYGTHMMDMINAGRFADGGLVMKWRDPSINVRGENAGLANASHKHNSLIQGVAATMGDQMLSSMASAGGGGAGVERWRGVALNALALSGSPLSWIGSLLRRMNQESGGNPRALNLWDSNARRGTPSVGLMQVIGPTYRAYRHPAFDVGPYMYGTSVNPLSNILASIRYTNTRYGSGPAGWDRRGGYERGTDFVPSTGMYELHRGEAVIPAHKNTGVQVIEIRSSGSSRFDDFLLDSLRKSIVTHGGVKVVLGGVT